MKKIMTSLFLIALITALFSACGMHGSPDPEQRMNYALWHVSGALDLREDQKREVKAIFTEVTRTMISMRQDHERSHERIVGMVRNGEINETTVNAVIDERLRKFEELRPVIVGKIVELYGILDNDQRQKAADLMEKRFSSRH